MSGPTRAALWGSAVALVLAGVLCASFIAGRTGETLAIVGGALGGIGLISLLFLEVGLSEDREREGRAASETPERTLEQIPPRRVRRLPRRRG